MSCTTHTVLWSAIFVAVIGAAPPAVADPIPVAVTGGSLAMQGGGGTISLVGDHGFTFNGGVGVTGGIFGPFETCFSCAPGATFSLFAHWLGNDLPGTATFEGVTYEGVGGLQPGRAFGDVTFSGSAIAPSVQALNATVTAPFLFEGHFTFVLPVAASASLSGAGTATVTLRRSTTDLPWSYQSAVYQLQPVPELGTMTLAGTSLAGLILRRRRRSAR
jgi:hypothetical protein